MGQEDPLEKEMATQSSILVWEIPWRDEPAGYSPWGHKESGMTEKINNNSKRFCYPLGCQVGTEKDKFLI